MPTAIAMQKPDENTTEVTLIRWLVKEGEQVRQGQPLAECVADKGEFEVWTEVSGTLLRIVAPEGSTVPVGFHFAVVGEPGEPLPNLAELNAAFHTGEGSLEGGKVRATPGARRLARHHDLVLSEVRMKLGVEGPVDVEHVERFLEAHGKNTTRATASRPSDSGRVVTGGGESSVVE